MIVWEVEFKQNEKKHILKKGYVDFSSWCISLLSQWCIAEPLCASLPFKKKPCLLVSPHRLEVICFPGTISPVLPQRFPAADGSLKAQPAAAAAGSRTSCFCPACGAASDRLGIEQPGVQSHGRTEPRPPCFGRSALPVIAYVYPYKMCHCL